MDAFQLFTEAAKPTGIWCCGKCRKLTLSPVWSPSSDNPRSTQEAAEACCRPPVCEGCGKDFERQYSNSSECRECERARRDREAIERLERLIEKAEDVTATYDGPLFIEGAMVSGDWGDEFFSDKSAVIESYEYEDEELPEWAFACKSRIEKLDLDRAIENLCRDGYEDMEIRLTMPPSLEAAIVEFNTTNEAALTVYETDYKRKVRLTREEIVQ